MTTAESSRNAVVGGGGRGPLIDEELLEQGGEVDRLRARLELFRSETEQLRLDEEKLRSADEAVERRLAELTTLEAMSGGRIERTK